MTDTDELTTWLAATLNTVEAAVIAYRDGHPGPCLNYAGQRPEDYTEYDSCYLHIRAAEASPYRDAAFGLADIAAKRRILAEHEIVYPGEEWQYCRVCEDSYTHDAMSAPCPTLRLLAEPLASHPGYRDEWRPVSPPRTLVSKRSTPNSGDRVPGP